MYPIEFLENNHHASLEAIIAGDYSDNKEFATEIIGEWLSNFAKLHIKMALETALENVPYGGSDAITYDDVKDILTCYPEDNFTD